MRVNTSLYWQEKKKGLYRLQREESGKPKYQKLRGEFK